MTLVKININTTRGYDTKDLFPGSLPHSGGKTAEYGVGQPQPHKWDYSHDVTGSTPRQKFVVIGTMNQISGGADLAGAMGQWEHYGKGGDIRLVYVQILNDPATFYTSANITSFSSLTPDNLVEALLADGQTAKLQFIGYTGDDTLRGSYWNDEFDGGKGADRMIGRFGDDIYRVNHGNDRVIEAADQGYDRVFTKINYTLPKHLESLVGDGTHKLALTGNDRNNDISGTSGSDTIKGLGGNDLIAAIGGKDVLYGGKGQDFFMFVTPPAAANVDTIKDFKHSADTIIISQHVHPGLTTPDYYYAHPFPGSPFVAPYTPLHPAAFHASASGKAHDFDDRILYNTDNGKLFFDPDGTGSAPRQLIAILSGHPTVAYDDFLII